MISIKPNNCIIGIMNIMQKILKKYREESTDIILHSEFHFLYFIMAMIWLM